MAENLRRLVSGEPLRTLHEQLERWRTEYSTNTCDQNLCQCLEFIEQISKVQGQLFRILTAAAQEGGHYDGVEIIKSRLLPWLEASFTAASLGKPVDSKVPSLQDTFDKEKHKESGVRDQDIQQIDAELNSTRSQLNQVQDDLAETEKTLEETKNRSAISLLAAEEEINQLRKQLKSLQAQEDSRHRSTEHKSVELRGAEPRASEQRKLDQRSIDKRNPDQRTEVIFDYEKQLRTLKDEIAVLSAEKSVLQGRSARSRTPSPAPHSRSRSQSRSRSTSPSTAVAKIRTPSPNHAKLSSVARKAALLSRFSDAYSQARLDAQCLLRRCIDKAETVQRIIYIATVEAFHVAKMAFRHFKIRVRKSLTPSLAGSNNFEDAVLDYIICHLDLYDSQSSVNDVIRAMNVNPKISFPPEVDFCLLSDFIQEICCIAFAMQTLDPPLDIAFGADGEIFNDCKYRRSYDSDFTAPLVFYHVWPALMENDCVIMKGEAVTKRGAFWNSVRSVSRCRSRSLSPICPRSRIGLSTLSRSRSPSPIRCGLPRF
ncbi:mitochondria-eating protein isoform X1 [Canis lupus baileyi]|uniref:Mitochondria-eating protein n=2 Tax=Canis lupus familiaris TaxID=9615 RepID=A0A8C0YXV2_CANLF|nr:mitochondria-eating protein isoform X1 [Canis lupus dingo]XP_038412001.1 mitochondria-eating protein isoform X1 [Canis lupus familiaris]XP_038541542.1 mitochondria-eating protein isoform X1 [Canis lupus familiaris]XP_532371.1 mitochondria-eating protein isoform X1 [Canis lupus familiaris]|eukprot:XP_532371.1 mitochondria-eating protein isoform X1 [Canis lupus familiaris]